MNASIDSGCGGTSGGDRTSTWTGICADEEGVGVIVKISILGMELLTRNGVDPGVDPGNARSGDSCECAGEKEVEVATLVLVSILAKASICAGVGSDTGGGNSNDALGMGGVIGAGRGRGRGRGGIGRGIPAWVCVVIRLTPTVVFALGLRSKAALTMVGGGTGTVTG